MVGRFMWPPGWPQSGVGLLSSSPPVSVSGTPLGLHAVDDRLR
ncbi:hypothetical protein [Nocardia sp. Marseille-Q1738]